MVDINNDNHEILMMIMRVTMMATMTTFVQSGCMVDDAYNSSDDVDGCNDEDDDGCDDNVDSVDDGSLYLSSGIREVAVACKNQHWSTTIK